ncbi:MAG TPA: hypothetical protein ENJ10_14705 [Caldithrix abyssi]|uniref:TonB C-terminal domain-containing protein n=1 Tax=Caldithrix abyssi TaxID=187145 RepID=A0A7V1PVM0_CALAY|nr:hypothetical protein [Caldithrix abyssi]
MQYRGNFFVRLLIKELPVNFVFYFYVNRDLMNRRKKTLIVAFILSLLFHIVLFYFLYFYKMWAGEAPIVKEQKQREVVIRFPENKEQPRTIVDNQNFNDQVPDKANLLSDRNATARNPERTTQTKASTPFSKGFSEIPNLAQPPAQKFEYKPRRRFSRNALTSKVADPSENGDSMLKQRDNQKPREQRPGAETSGSQWQQQKFSVEEVGSLSLSTYKWNWAPYIRKLKQKHQSVWFTPPAYSRLGLIHGRSKVYIEIDRQGRLINLKVIGHSGHESLLNASVESLKATFPFLPLPDDFPEKTLGITATLVYPDLRKRR